MIGLVLSVLLNQAAFGEVGCYISETFLGEEDILLESFEFLHETVFQAAAMAFFATSALIIHCPRVLWSFNATLDLSEEPGEGDTIGTPGDIGDVKSNSPRDSFVSKMSTTTNRSYNRYEL